MIGAIVLGCKVFFMKINYLILMLHFELKESDFEVARECSRTRKDLYLRTAILFVRKIGLRLIGVKV